METFTREELRSVLDHHGYGNPAGPLWFLGMEESLGGDADHDAQLRRRIDRLCHPVDTMEHYTRVVWPGRPMPRTSTWRYMAILARYLVHRADDWDDLAAAEHYVRHELVTQRGATFMLDFLPIPAPSVNAWPYLGLPWKTRQDYHREIVPYRTALLRDLVMTCRPEIVIAYGKSFWNYRIAAWPNYQDLFPGATFAPIAGLGNWLRYGRQQGTAVLMTPFFGRELPYEDLLSLPAILERNMMDLWTDEPSDSADG